MFPERTFWVYPRDIADGKPYERLADIWRLDATAISIPFSYHSLRALAPHNSRRKVINTTAAVCFRPRAGEFLASGIEPACSEWATDEGLVPNLFGVTESFGLRVRAWTVVFHNTLLASLHFDSAVTNCSGDVFVHGLCPSALNSRERAPRLVRAISMRPVDAIELEAAGFYGYEHLSHHNKCRITFDLFHYFLFSSCFCHRYNLALRSSGLDPDLISGKFRECLLRFLSRKAFTVASAEHANAAGTFA